MDRQTKVFRAHRALAWFYAVLGVGVTAAVVLTAPDKNRFASLFLALIFIVPAAAHLFTARACRAGKPGGRVASIVIACFMLIGVPIGTLIGVYLLANTWRPWAPAGEGLVDLNGRAM